MIRILSIATLCLVITACANQSSKNMNPVESAFDTASKMACNIRFKNDQKYCDCFVNTLNSITPYDKKKVIAKGGNIATQEMASIMLSNRDNLDKCLEVAETNLRIPSYELTPLAIKVRDKYKSSLLTPEKLQNLAPLSKPIGYEYQLQKANQTTLDGVKFRLSKVDGDKYYLDYVSEAQNINKKNKYNIKWEYLPLHEFMGGQLIVINTMKNQFHTPPKSIIMHHATCNVGQIKKLKQMTYVRDYVKKHYGR